MLPIPPPIEEAIQRFNVPDASFAIHDVDDALKAARKPLGDLAGDENAGFIAEHLAFAVITASGYGPWGTLFAPVGTWHDKEGNEYHSPNIRAADARAVAHWKERARSVVNPILKARYADMAWEMCGVVADEKRDVEMARIAIDAYIDACPSEDEFDIDEYDGAIRALDLAILIGDKQRVESARGHLLDLQRAKPGRDGAWWQVFDRLIDKKNTGLTDAERDELVANLEGIVASFSDLDPANFDPHRLKQAADYLIKHYTRRGMRDDVKRLQILTAKTFEHFAAQGDALLASMVLETSVESYRAAGEIDESKRVRVAMQEKTVESHAQMVPIETGYRITKEDMDAFLARTILDTGPKTLAKIASAFLSKRANLEERMRKQMENTPLMAMLGMSLVSDNHVAAKIGSVNEDPFGRAVHEAQQSLTFEAPWLHAAIQAARERHGITPDNFVEWSNRHGIFDDTDLIAEGVRAWHDGDNVKAAHVLVPQIERGLRGIVGHLGLPTTKAHGKIRGVSVAVTMGEMLYDDAVTEALGPDLTLYFLSIYADPRGKNWRNMLAHGLAGADIASETGIELLIHTLLIFGCWKELAAARRPKTDAAV